jgi:hypothetical protein
MYFVNVKNNHTCHQYRIHNTEKIGKNLFKELPQDSIPTKWYTCFIKDGTKVYSY